MATTSGETEAGLYRHRRLRGLALVALAAVMLLAALAAAAAAGLLGGGVLWMYVDGAKPFVLAA